MTRLIALALFVFLTTGCAGLTGSAPRVDTVSFDRGAFALTYADLIARIRTDCAKSPGNKSCAGLEDLDRLVRQAIIDAPKAAAAGAQPMDLSTILPILMRLAAF